jgi:hypothetical protein
MNRRSMITAVVLAGMTLLTLAPAVLADTCCANTSVTPVPRSAMPGDTVRLDGIACLNPDNSGPLPLHPVEFWLSTDRVPADPNPGDTPGDPDVHLANDLPPAGQWLPFASVTGEGKAAVGSATIVIPDLANGKYQLWWRCDNGGGEGSGIHYSGAPLLAVGAATPDTATAEPASKPRPATPSALPWVIALAAGLLTLRRVGTVRRISRR